MKRLALALGLIFGPQLPSYSNEIEDLDQRLKIIERKFENSQESTDTAKKADATVSAGSNGFIIQSADKNYSLKLGGLLQLDSRSYFGDTNTAKANDYLVRKARLNIGAALGERVKLGLVGDFAGTSASLIDAYVDLKLFSWSNLRIGRFKTPISLENFRSDPARDFVEPGFSYGLTTIRDNGAWLEFSDPEQAVILGGGIFNGGIDGGTTVGAASVQDDKDWVAKVFVHPARFFDTLFLRDFGIGVAGSLGQRLPGSAVASYKSTGQQTVASYKALTTERDKESRYAPQAYLFIGPFSVQSEFVRSEDTVANPANVSPTALQWDTAGRQAWQASASWVITGEDAAFNGIKWNKETTSAWGALQLVGRYQEFAFDDANVSLQKTVGPKLATNDSGQRFIDPRSSVRKIQGWGAGLNWALNPNTKFLLDWEENYFTDGAQGYVDGLLSTINRESETTLFARAQFSY